jgi:bacillopeptidase F (M6 metalloprotease family)
VFGNPVVALEDDGSNTANWNTLVWDNTSEDFVSPPTSITDSRFTVYEPNDVNRITLASQISLVSALDARLSFYAKWQIEKGYDYVQVEASDDNGNTWSPLCGKYTVAGTSSQAPGEPVYDGHRDWVFEEMSLNDFIGGNLLIRFSIITDPFLELDGFYFDDLKIEYVTANTGEQAFSNTPFISPAHPNPASDFSFINYSGLKEGSSISVFNSLGEKVIEKKINAKNGTVRLDVGDLASGVYTYFISGNDGRTAGKLTVR